MQARLVLRPVKPYIYSTLRLFSASSLRMRLRLPDSSGISIAITEVIFTRYSLSSSILATSSGLSTIILAIPKSLVSASEIAFILMLFFARTSVSSDKACFLFSIKIEICLIVISKISCMVSYHLH